MTLISNNPPPHHHLVRHSSANWIISLFTTWWVTHSILGLVLSISSTWSSSQLSSSLYWSNVLFYIWRVCQTSNENQTIADSITPTFSIIVIIVNINIVVIVINNVITTIVFIAVSKCFCHWGFRDVWLEYSRIQRLEPTTKCGASWNRWAFWAIIVFKRINSILIWSIEMKLRNDTTLIWMKCPRSTRWPIQKTWWSKDETVERWKNHVADIFFVYS